MTLQKDEQGTLIHYPSKADLFEFDADVAKIFDSMAARSIPGYSEAHQLHAYIAERWISAQLPAAKRPLLIADVGASTGGFFAALHKEMWRPYKEKLPHLELHAIDTSRHMLDQINQKLPHVMTFEQNLKTLSNLGHKYDMINISYVLQFLKPAEIVSAMRELRDCFQPNGLLFLSQKEKIESGFGDLFQDRYIGFRKDNGYSEEEIAAKTKALKNAMFPMSNRVQREVMMQCGFGNIQETARWLQFSSMVAIAS